MPPGRAHLRVQAAALVAIACCGGPLTACGGSKAHTSAGAGTIAVNGAHQPGAAGGTATPPSGVAGSREVTRNTVRAVSGAVTATMHASTQNPRVNAHWPISFAVTAGGRPARAQVEYEYLFGGAVVAHRSHYRFTGGFHDVFQWPTSAVGYPLTFRAVIKSGGATLNLDYPVQVRR